MVQTTKTISFTEELDRQLGEAVDDLNKTQITGAISKSKIIRVAVSEYLEKLNKIKKIRKDYADVTKTAEDILFFQI